MGEMTPQEVCCSLDPGPKPIVIKVEIQTTDMARVKVGPALVDSRATSLFMSQSYIE